MKVLTETAKRKRKLLLVLPLLILPFISLIFWALGGGKHEEADTRVVNPGLNLQLPDAKLKDDQHLDKMSYYKKAVADSAKFEEQIRKDPYYKKDAPGPDTIESRIYERLAELDREMNDKNEIMPPGENEPEFMFRDITPPSLKAPVQPDPELQQLDGMLDKIIAIQNPSATMDKQSHNRSANKSGIAVSSERILSNVSLLAGEKITHSSIDTGFYDGVDKLIMAVPNAIEAVVHETRTIVNGSVIKLRLLTDIFLSGQLIPKGNFIYGTASLSGERLLIEISSIRYNQSIFPVTLSVYDVDGMDGLFIPGAITRELSKESSGRLMQGIALNSLNPSVATQAASAGIEAAKSLLTKKVKMVRVTVKAGYKIFLKTDK